MIAIEKQRSPMQEEGKGRRKVQQEKQSKSLASQLFQSLIAAAFELCRAFKQPIILRPMAWFFIDHCAKSLYRHVLLPNRGLAIGCFFSRFAHIGLSITIFLDMVLVSRTNVGYGVSDKTMVLFGSALADAINQQLKFMPFLILSGRLCPPGIEGSLFALFMTINTVGSFMGTGFTSWNLIRVIQVFCTYVPVLFLFLIPKEATGVSSS